VTCGCPIAAGDGHDFPRLIDEHVPGVTAVIDDIIASMLVSSSTGFERWA
jgi:hypothetical protein